ncbi:MAG TPA: hypothetical protein PKD09_09455 [Aggregatilinea sp.]|uniref:hypothetical protein n=1 Tax=Aggregatilinea sp. TaxID=2806333 RepID=UPI002BFF5EAC|nr:hypothetical protein [Aggregatilinea sp.]HML21863.1 hypothetical protein [Aggregatilinea sp.]
MSTNRITQTALADLLDYYTMRINGNFVTPEERQIHAALTELQDRRDEDPPFESGWQPIYDSDGVQAGWMGICFSEDDCCSP